MGQTRLAAYYLELALSNPGSFNLGAAKTWLPKTAVARISRENATTLVVMISAAKRARPAG